MRSAEFDHQEVLRAVMTVLSKKGYAKTRVQDLKKATGLHPGSIYSAFNDKRGLFIAALKQYQEDRFAFIDDLFSNSPTLLAGVYAFVDCILEDYEQVKEKDCLFQKLLTEVSDHDDEIEQMVKNMIKSLRQKFTDKFQLMMDRNEIEANRDVNLLAQFFFMCIYGMRTMSYTNPEPGVLKNLRDELMQYIEGYS